MIKQNLHTHTCLDHGKDTVDELAQTALKQGFTTLGYSGHSYNKPLSTTCMSLENHKIYEEQVKAAREKYKDQLEIFYGIEQDSMNRIDCSGYDYVIGSVHYLKKDGRTWMIDQSIADFDKMLQEGWHGDIEQMVRDYYDSVMEMMDWPEVDIVGHIDLIAKYNEDQDFFSFYEPWYLEAAKKAIDKGIEKGLIFEMNTGAIARKNRLTPYPHPLLLKHMADNGAKLCINTDCHNARYLDLKIEECLDLARKAGFTQLMHLTNQGFAAEPLESFTGSRIHD